MTSQTKLIAARCAVSAAALLAVLAPSAGACGNPTTPAGGAALNALRMAPSLLTGSRLTQARAASTAEVTPAASDNSPFIVGMWEVTMRVDGALYDHALQQLYADGNEMQNSGLFPPEVGNICFGTWKQIDARTFRLKHYGWLFDHGSFIGTFVLTASITVGTPAGGNTYFGNFVADTILPDGAVDPTQHAEGTVQATRLALN